MANSINNLSDRFIKSAPPGDHADGGGLIMRVSGKGKRVWFFRGRLQGRRFYIRLGVYNSDSSKGITRDEARAKRDEANKWIDEGLDPKIMWQRRADELNKVEEVKEVTFGELAEEYLPEFTADLTNAKSRQQWHSTFNTYLKPKPIWRKPISQVTNKDVTDALKPHWKAKRETMSRLRGRIERLMNTAIGLDLYHKTNPAVWAIQKNLVGDVSKRVKHHTSLEHESIPDFWHSLDVRDGISAACLRLLILTALRTTECRGAYWSEFDFDRMVWTVPANRMKMRRTHEVPITTAMMSVLNTLPGERDGLVFRNPTYGGRLSENGMLSLLKDMGSDAHNTNGEKITPHGFRSSFRNWIGDMTTYDERLAEHQLAHAVRGTEGHYRTRTALLKRSEMMEQWGQYVTGKIQMQSLPSNIIVMAG